MVGKHFILILVAVLSIGVISGCGRISSPERPSNAPPSIVYPPVDFPNTPQNP